MKSLKQTLNEAFNENKNDYHLIRSYLGELWFARHNGETTKYKELAKKLDGLKVPFAVQNEVAYDASNTTKKAIDTLEVQDRIAKILKKHNINESFQVNESLTAKQVMKIASTAGEIILDAEDELMELVGAYGDKIPKSRVKEILVNYDLNMKGDIN